MRWEKVVKEFSQAAEPHQGKAGMVSDSQAEALLLAVAEQLKALGTASTAAQLLAATSRQAPDLSPKDSAAIPKVRQTCSCIQSADFLTSPRGC